MSGITLSHSESDFVPVCTVTFGAGRIGEDGRTDDRRVEITFEHCYYARVGPHHDTEDIEAIGYAVEGLVECEEAVDIDQFAPRWREIGLCPDPGFYVARRSEWLDGLPDRFRRDFRHYVVDGRDGYVELIARRYRWEEWSWWMGTHREQAPTLGPVIGGGEGDA